MSKAKSVALGESKRDTPTLFDVYKLYEPFLAKQFIKSFKTALILNDDYEITKLSM